MKDHRVSLELSKKLVKLHLFNYPDYLNGPYGEGQFLWIYNENKWELVEAESIREDWAFWEQYEKEFDQTANEQEAYDKYILPAPSLLELWELPQLKFSMAIHCIPVISKNDPNKIVGEKWIANNIGKEDLYFANTAPDAATKMLIKITEEEK
jgi:hypothetical protein